MSRDDLRKLLLSASGDAAQVCLATLDDPATKLNLEVVSDHLATETHLVTIYSGRAESVRRAGIPALGIDEAVEALRGTVHDRVRLALLNPDEGYPWCVIFLAPDCSAIVASLAVMGPRPTTQPA